MKISRCVLFWFVVTKCASSEVLHGKNHEIIDPEKQPQDESDVNDQSKRTLFDADNKYALEKHVKLHHSGYKYLLGYRPVKLTYVPVAKPLYFNSFVKPVRSYAKPIVSLLPPKISPLYKPGYFGNDHRPTSLPVHVPPSEPQKPWQQQGWTPITDNKPFVPSFPAPEPANSFVEQELPSLSTPVVPTPQSYPVVQAQPLPINAYYPVAPPPVLQVSPVVPKPFVPALPLQPTLPIAQPIVPTVHPAVPIHPSSLVHPAVPIHPPSLVHVHPIHPVPAVNHNLPNPFHITGRLPINLLPGKLNIPVPDLGVLPLGSTVPVQITQQAQPQFVHKPQLFIPEQHFLNKYPQVPTGVFHQNPVETPIHQQPQTPIHILVQHAHQSQENFPQPMHNFQHYGQEQPVQYSVEESPEQTGGHYQHNYHQQTNEPVDHYEHNNYNQQSNQPDSTRFYQPGKTDLQIPEYLPEHPHFKASQFQPDSNYGPYK